MIGIPSSPEQIKRPFPTSSNPVWDEIQQAHATLSPNAQKAVAMSGVPQRAALVESESVPGPTSFAPLAKPIRSQGLPDIGTPPPASTPAIAGKMEDMPGIPVAKSPLEGVSRSSLPMTLPDQHSAELERVRSTGSGISQIKSPIARHGLQVLDAVGSMFFPQITSMIPGTQLHHEGVQSEAESAVAGDQKQEEEETRRRLAESQIPLNTANAAEAEANAEAKKHPAPPAPHVVGKTLVDASGNPLYSEPQQTGVHVVDGALVDDTGKALYTTPKTGNWQIETSTDSKGNVWTYRINKDTGEHSEPVNIGPVGKPGSDPASNIELSPEAIDYWALAASQGVPLPSMGMGASGAKARQAIINRAAQLATDPLAGATAQRKADQASLAKIVPMTDAVRAFERTASKNLDLFVSKAKPIIDSNSPWINIPLREVGKQGLGSGDLAAYDAARQVALTEIAKVVNNPSLSSVLSDTARKEVMGLIPESATLKQIYEVVAVLKQDMANRMLGLDQTRKEIEERLGIKSSNTEPQSTPPQQESGKVEKWERVNGKLVKK